MKQGSLFNFSQYKMNKERPVIYNAEILDIHSSGNHYFIFNEKKYYVSKVLSGEVVDAKILNKRLGFRIASVIDIKKKSNHRIIPNCEHYHLCEGCNFLHIEYNEQLNIKKRIIQKAFNKYNINFEVFEIEPAKKNINYRNNGTFKIKNENNNYFTGFIYDKKSFIKIYDCKILKKEINNLNLIVCEWLNSNGKKLEHLNSFTIRANNDGLCIIMFHTKNSLNIELEVFEPLKKYFIGIYVKSDIDFKIIYEIKSFYENLFGITFKVHPLTFFQNNVEITEKMISFINLNIPMKNFVLYDLYCGNSSLSLPLLYKNDLKVIGIDNNPYAIADANYNSKQINKENQCMYFCGDVLRTFNQHFIEKNLKPDIIILDPPRSGTLIEILKNVVNSNAKYVVYVSCNPVSLAWNLSLIKERYKLLKVKAFDMFPQTHHLETVVILEKIS